MGRKALLVVRDALAAETLRSCLSIQWTAETVQTAEDAMARLASGGVDLIFADLEETGVEGGTFVTQFRTLAPWTPIILLISSARREDAPAFIAQGATDFILKPLVPGLVRIRVEGAMGRSPRKPSAPMAKSEEAILMGQSPAMLGAREQATIVAPTEIPVLILGESGTGRGVIARQIHYQSLRADGPFIVVNCLGPSEDLLDAEFFGREEPEGRVPGQIEEAAGGSLFFDEVADLPLGFQVRLLRILKDRTFARPGETTPRQANVRFIFSSSRDLAEEVAGKRFREDLYYRIQTFPLRVPPLRERTEDIPVLARTFLQSYCRELGKPFEGFSDEAMECLLWYPWPGNVRELQTRMRFCALYLRGAVLRRDDLPFELQGYTGRGVGSYAHARLQFEREYLTRLLRKHRGNVNRMAKEAAKQRVELYRMLKRCGLDPSKFRV